jgi:UTP--glucose-1-phosphate uridylyltransferase
VILAAGMGSRMLPATKAVPKEMLPIVDRPLIQYAVEEASAAGIREIVFVIAEGRDAIREHFSAESAAEARAAANGDTALCARIREPALLGRFSFAVQEQPLGIADAVRCARPHVDGAPFLLMFPDDLIIGPSPVAAQLVEAYGANGGTVIAVQQVADADVSQYGIVDPAGEGNPFRLRGIVEKPAPEDAPSRYGVVGRYILSETIFGHIERIPPGKNGELQLTDAIASQVMAGEPVSGFAFEGERHDTGRPAGFVAANAAVALSRPEFAAHVHERLGRLLEKMS